MKYFKIPKKINNNLFVSPNIKVIDIDNYHKIIAVDNIKSNTLIIQEYPVINLFGEKDIDRALQTIQKYILLNENQLYPRTKEFIKTKMIKDVHKIIKNSNNKLINFFKNYDDDIIEFYYAKYLYNSFEGYNYGPLTLPTIAKLNHSCNNNVDFIFDEYSGCMNVFTNKYIKKDSELYDNYLLNKNIDNHKEYLLNHYGFICHC